MLVGITGTNQQFPLEQPYNAASNNAIRITLNPKFGDYHIDTDAGAIGMAVNGIPLFDPSTQAAAHPDTGERPHTLDKGELDECGGHAGRGDDYHYHIAPKCLIEDLAKDKIDNQKLPIGYAKDGYSIHAVGWFDPANDIEAKLDACRGATDVNGLYFYNVKMTSKWDIINCFSGEPVETGPRGSTLRYNKNGNPMSGGQGFKGMIPLKFRYDSYEAREYGEELCHFGVGEVSGENLLLNSGEISRNYRATGTIFYCTSGCYAHFFESDEPTSGGRVTEYDLITASCPSSLNVNDLQLFDD